MTISLAAVFLVKIRACRVKNARKMSNLAALFSLQARIFPQKTASQAECQQPLDAFFARAFFVEHGAEAGEAAAAFFFAKNDIEKQKNMIFKSMPIKVAA